MGEPSGSSGAHFRQPREKELRENPCRSKQEGVANDAFLYKKMKTTIGYNTTSRGVGESVEVGQKDRRHHVYIIGKTGTGKSTLIKNMAVEDIRNGNGVAVVDPHGDLAEDVLNFIPKNRVNDVIYFNPADVEHPPGLNVLEVKDAKQKQLVASSLLSVFRYLWADSWGPRTEYLLHNA